MDSTEYRIKLILDAQNEMGASLADVQKQLEDMQKWISNASSWFSKFGNILKTAGIAVGVAAITKKVIDLGKACIDLGASYEQATISFTTMLGSWEQAQIMLQQLSDFAKTTPFELQGVRDNATQLLGMGINAQDIIPTLKALGDVSAWLNIELDRVALNYWQVATQGKLTGAELRDFSRAGIPLLAELAKNLNVTEAEIQDMVSKGKIWFSDVEKAFQTMTSEGGRFANLMDAQSKSFNGIISNIKDWLSQIWEQIGTNLIEKLKPVLEAIAWFVDQYGAMFWQVFSDLFGAIFDIIGSVRDLVTSFFKVFDDSTRDGVSSVKVFSTALALLLETVSTVVNWVSNGIQTVTGAITTYFSNLFGNFSGTVKSLANYAIQAINYLSRLANKVWIWEGKQYSLFEWEDVDKFKQSRQEYWKSTSDMRKNFASQTANAYDWIIKGTYWANKVTWELNSTVKSLWSSIADTGDKASGSTKANTEALKKIKDTYKSITDSVDDQYDQILKVNKERKKGFKEIEDNLDDVDKNIKNLKDDISDLRKELAQLWKEETSDIASEFVNARKELQKMERDYKGIWEVASKYSLSDLENYQYWGIGKYDIDALIQYKKYSNELNSVYEGLNDQERKAMDEQIAYQERYQSLNGIEKIKEDYRIKREEIQSELNEKMSALHSEEIKRAEINKQMQQYQKERLEAIDVERKKRGQMYKEKMDYEKQYMEQLEIDTSKQLEMYNELIRKARELAQVRADTGGPTGTRATGGPVYWGQSYIVGENGPELFVPSQNGKIVPNEKMGGEEIVVNLNMGGVVINNDSDEQELANKISETITRQLQLYKRGIL